MIRGFRHLLIGITVGAMLGLGIRALEKYAAKNLLGLLEDELKIACPACSLEYDSADMSIFTLRSAARNARVMEGGKARLTFRKVQGDFSLRQLSQHLFTLEELRLIDGNSDGVLAESATYKFIDQLCAPPPPGKDYPGRWKVQLHTLKVKKSRFTQKAGAATLNGTGVELVARRTPDDFFELKPVIKDLYLSFPTGTNVPLGRVTSDMFIHDDYVQFRELALVLKKSALRIRAKADSNNDYALTGNLDFSVDSRTAGFPDWLSFSINGTGNLGGEIDEPASSGTFENRQGTRMDILRISSLPLSFSRLRGAYDFVFDGKTPAATFSDTTADSESLQLSIPGPFYITDETVDGEINIRSPSLTFPGLDLKGVALSMKLAGAITSPLLEVNGKVQNVILANGFQTGKLDVALVRSGNTLSTRLDRTETAGEALTVEGDVELPQSGIPFLKKGTFEARDLPLSGIIPDSAFNTSSPLRLDAKGTFSGPLSLSDLSGQGQLIFKGGPLAEESPLEGKLALDRGVLTARFSSALDTLKAELSMPVAQKETGRPLQAQASLLLKNYAPYQHLLLGSGGKCGRIDLEAHYNFGLSAPLKGSGGVNVSRFSLGCPPSDLNVTRPVTIPITDGTAGISDISMVAGNAAINVSGQIDLESGYKLRLTGDLRLESLLPLIPAVDEFSGLMSVVADISGELAAPHIEGTGNISDAGIGVEAADISARKINSKLAIDGSRITVESFSGFMNQGKVEAHGALDLNNLEQSALNLRIEKMVLEPASDLSVVLTAELSLSKDSSNRPAVSGTVVIDSAHLQRTIDWASIAAQIISGLSAGSRNYQARASALDMPDINLNLAIASTGNMVIMSNLVNTSLDCNMVVHGSIKDPVVAGSINAVSGWFGLRDRKFFITDGRLIFDPQTALPILEVLGETSVRSRQGETITVWIEIRGPLANPKVTLSSDRGLPERELLRLLTVSGDLIEAERITTIGQDVKIDALPFLKEDSFLGMGGLMRRLARIDSVSLQPSFNPTRGILEPMIVARKDLSPSLYLLAESALVSQSSETRFKAVQRLSTDLKLTGLVEMLGQQSTTSYGADLAWTILTDLDKSVLLKAHGNWAINDLQIFSELKLNESSRIQADYLGNLEEAVRELYRERGYFSAAVTASCRKSSLDQSLCSRLDFDIEENEQFTISEVKQVGEPLPSGFEEECLSSSGGQPASREYMDSCLSRILSALRSDGYISARTDGHYEPDPGKLTAVMFIDIVTGEKTAFRFSGNKAFRNSDFFATINLLERKQPFGSNTINILTQNIDRLYRESGFLNVSVASEKTRDPESGSTIYEIRIDEGKKVPVSRVLFEGNPVLTEKEIAARFTQQASLPASTLVSPPWAVREAIEMNARILERIVRDEGYPEARVQTELKPSSDGTSAEISYRIEAGTPDPATGILIEGFPADIQYPELPDQPFSVEKINQFINALTEALTENGYLFYSLSTSKDPQKHLLIIKVTPGMQTKTGEVEVSGNIDVSRSTILEKILIKPGDPLRISAIEESRRALYRLGLFSRVDIRPTDGKADSAVENISVKVVERPLTTLELGGGANSTYGLHAFGLFTDRSLFADGRTLSTRLDLFWDPEASDISQGVAGISYSDPAAVAGTYGWVEDLRFIRLDQTNLPYDLDQVTLASYLHNSWQEGLISATLGHTLLGENLNNVQPDSVITSLDTSNNMLSFISGSLALDKRDDPLNPSEGWNLVTSGNLSTEALGSEANYFMGTGRFSFLAPLTERYSLASGTTGGSIWSFAGTDHAPISQRFFIGGRTTIRGYSENSVGPRGDMGSMKGSDVIMYENFELRRLMAEAFEMHVFMDTGIAYLRKPYDSGGGFRTGTGLGARYLSPVGPVSLDLGFPLDRQNGDDSWELHFSIGTNF